MGMLEDVMGAFLGDNSAWGLFRDDVLLRYPDQPFRSLQDLSRASWERYGPENSPTSSYDMVNSAYPMKFAENVKRGEENQAGIKASGKIDTSTAADKLRSLQARGRPSDYLAAEMTRETMRKRTLEDRMDDLLRPRPVRTPGGIRMEVDPNAVALYDKLVESQAKAAQVEQQGALIGPQAQALEASAMRDAMYAKALGEGTVGRGTTKADPQMLENLAFQLQEQGKLTQGDVERVQRAIALGDINGAVDIIQRAGETAGVAAGAGQGTDLVFGQDF